MDDNYGNQRLREALCIITLAEAIGERKKGKQVDEGLGDRELSAGTTKQKTCTGQVGKRTRQQDSGVRRQREGRTSTRINPNLGGSGNRV